MSEIEVASIVELVVSPMVNVSVEEMLGSVVDPAVCKELATANHSKLRISLAKGPRAPVEVTTSGAPEPSQSRTEYRLQLDIPGGRVTPMASLSSPGWAFIQDPYSP